MPTESVWDAKLWGGAGLDVREMDVLCSQRIRSARGAAGKQSTCVAISEPVERTYSNCLKESRGVGGVPIGSELGNRPVLLLRAMTLTCWEAQACDETSHTVRLSRVGTANYTYYFAGSQGYPNEFILITHLETKHLFYPYPINQQLAKKGCNGRCVKYVK